MKIKAFITLVGLAIIVPQIALAAWWNPFSWFDNWAFLKNDETETLERRIEELEDELGQANGSESGKEAVGENTAIEERGVEGSMNEDANQGAAPKLEDSQIPQTSVLVSQPVDFRAGCKLSEEVIDSGDLVEATLNIPFMRNVEYEVEWDDKYLVRVDNHNSAYFRVDSSSVIETIYAVITRKEDGHSKTVSCEVRVNVEDPEPIDNRTDAERLCDQAKEDALEISQSIEDALAEHQEIVNDIQTRVAPWSQGAALAQENNRYNPIRDTLYAKLTSANYTVQLYCN